MRKTSKYLLVLLIVLVMSGAVRAQQAFMPVLYQPDTLPAGSEKTLFLRITNNNFLFDAEYFSPLESGFTWIGLQFQPELVYQVSEHFLLKGGVYLLKYSGREETSDVRPVFTAVYKFSEAVSLVMGSFYGSLNHRLPEPLYQYDRSMYDFPEEGVQVLVHTSWLEGDYWLQWRNFILPGDPFQEQLVFGTSSRFRVFRRMEGWRFTIPVYTMIHHKGGQIDSSPEPVHTFGNLAGGVAAEKMLGSGFFRSVTGELLVYNYFDNSGQPLFNFTSGWGIRPVAGVTAKNMVFRLGYWYGHNFFAFLGEPLYASVSEKTDAAGYPDRSLLTFKVKYGKTFEKGVGLTLYGNGYYDLKMQRFDYNVGLQLLFNADFRLLPKKQGDQEE